MTQHDFVIDGNQPFPAYGTDLNNALLSLATNSAGTTEPVVTFPHQIWVDSGVTPNQIKMRNAGNTAWVTLGQVSTDLGLPNLTTVNNITNTAVTNAITSSNTEPTSPVSNQLWIDTSVNPALIKIRNQANDNWITIGTATDNFGVNPTSIGSCFHARRITTAQSLANNTLTTVIFNGEVTDTHGQYNNATGIFTCSIPGFYNFNTNIRLVASGTTITSCALMFLRNGTLEIRGNEFSAGLAATVVSLSMSYAALLAANDTVAVRVRTNTANSSATTIDAQVTALEPGHFSGMRVG
jgi:hypothetical protein